MLYLDTSVLVPLFVPEPESAALRGWLESNAAASLAISDWTLTEFASAMGIKVRTKALKPEQARKACELMDRLAADSFRVFTPTRSDFGKAAEYLGHHSLGLRAGDALHLAVAQNEGAERFYTVDRRLIEAGRRLKVAIASPV
ncbi:MAG TPA: type II toxin-antitoxin system VapC family toxin [Solimonas sp.]|nr:type II toxin-antitoxin system VapC family toxin [Solimonas sp.]